MTKQAIADKDEFRDHLTTIGEDGKRKWIFPWKPKGKYYSNRSWVSLLYYVLFFSLPLLHFAGKPLFLFNFPKGKFILFGYIFWPQDFLIFGLIMMAGLLFIALFTMAFGRVFCGWICPQTVFMEMLFRRVDYLVLGTGAAQKKLATDKWTNEKIRKYTTRYVIYFILSFIIANTFLAYIIGIKELWEIITTPVTQHIGGFSAILIFTTVFFGVFSFLREQVCTTICPYGRLQGVLLDKNTIIVAYDYKRGEPRGKFSKKVDTNLGDCINCHQCVQVCPTGIDIRNGTQLECTNCTACIDACNVIMDKISKPQGLIRYDSENNIAEGKKFVFTPRLKVYSAVLSIILIAITTMLISRKNVDGTILRTAGMLYQERGTDSVSNLYSIKLMNKTADTVPLTLKLHGIEGHIQMVGKPVIVVKPEEQASATFFIVLPRKIITDHKQKLKVDIYENSELINTKNTTFLGPVKRKL